MKQERYKRKRPIVVQNNILNEIKKEKTKTLTDRIKRFYDHYNNVKVCNALFFLLVMDSQQMRDQKQQKRA